MSNKTGKDIDFMVRVESHATSAINEVGTLITSAVTNNRLYKTETEKSVQTDISGNIETETETFWLVYDTTKMPYITIVKKTQNDISYGIFLEVRADLGATDVKSYGNRINEFISAISTIMIKTDDDAIITLTDSNPSVVKTGEWQGLALPSIIATHPISSELFAQLKNAIVWCINSVLLGMSLAVL